MARIFEQDTGLSDAEKERLDQMVDGFLRQLERQFGELDSDALAKTFVTLFVSCLEAGSEPSFCFPLHDESGSITGNWIEVKTLLHEGHPPPWCSGTEVVN